MPLTLRSQAWNREVANAFRNGEGTDRQKLLVGQDNVIIQSVPKIFWGGRVHEDGTAKGRRGLQKESEVDNLPGTQKTVLSKSYLTFCVRQDQERGRAGLVPPSYNPVLCCRPMWGIGGKKLDIEGGRGFSEICR